MRKFAIAFTLGLVFAAGLASAQLVFGLVAGPVGVGYPQLRVVNGTATNPSVMFASDSNSGLFQPGAGLVSAAIAGAEAMRVTTGVGPVRTNAAVGALSTAGAGTITAALMANGLINRTGPTGAFTDTTDTAAAIDTALGTPPVGTAFDFEYGNGVAFAATLAGGTNVTIVGSTGVVASGSRLIRCVKTAATPAYSCG